MSVGPVPVFSPSTTIQVEPGAVRLRQTPIPILGSNSGGENRHQRGTAAVATLPQDVVKVQLEAPGETVVYQFVNQQGTVVLQVPPQQLIELAQQIAQELERKPTSDAASARGNNNGR